MLAATTLQAELKLYEVEFQYRAEVFDALQGILQAGRPGMTVIGKVEMLPIGLLLVDAPEITEFPSGIEK